MNDTATGEMFFPQFPALSRCVIVDASLRSRTDMMKYLKASTMFEEIIEAKSLDDGLEQLRQREVDALFIGPSIQIERTASFVEQSQSASRAKDCAFILIHRERIADSELVTNSDVHVTVLDTVSKRAFTEAIVRAVLLACDDSPWPGVRLDTDGNVMVSDKGVWKKFSADTAAEPKKVEREAEGMSALLTENVLGILAHACGETVQAKSMGELSRLLSKILRDQGSTDGEDLAAETRRVVQEWALDKDYMGPNEASKLLKKKLLALGKNL